MKRFTETNKWQNPWYRRLTPEAKLLWQWLLDHCDPAGVIEADFELATFQIGVEIDDAVINELGERIVKIPSGKSYIPSFVEFQYGKLSAACKPHQKVFAALARHGIDHFAGETQKGKLTLSDRVSERVFNTLEEEEEEEKEEEDKKEEGCGEKPTPAELITVEAIVSSYPRREETADCLKIVASHIANGEDPEAMLSGTRAIAAAIAQWPGGPNNRYCIAALKFFRGKRWNDDPATWLRQANPAGTTSDGSKLELGGRRPSSVTKIPYEPAK
jgi:hypothetical protein